VGARNHRAFVLCLLAFFVSFVYLQAIALYEIMAIDLIKRSILKIQINEYCFTQIGPLNPSLEIALDVVILGLVLIKYLARLIFGDRISFGS